MDIEQLQVFLAIVDRGSVLGAAELLKLPRSTVRNKLDTLEREFGVALLTRTRDGAEATAAGMALAERARPLVNQLQALPNSVREEMNIPVGELHIRLPIGLPPELVGLGAGLFRDRYPEVPLHFSFSEDPCAHLPADVDMLLHFGPQLPRGAFKTQALQRVDERLMASPVYLATHGTPQSLTDLHNHNLLVWRLPGEDPRALPTLSGSKFPIGPVIVSSDIHSLRFMVAAGAGIGLIPTARFQATVEEDGLVHLLPDLVGQERILRLAIPEIRADLPRNRAALRLIREILAGAVGFEQEDDAGDKVG